MLITLANPQEGGKPAAERLWRSFLPHLETGIIYQDQTKRTEDVLLASTLVQLASLYLYVLSQPKQALAYYERALKIKEAHYGPDHYEVASTLVGLGIAYGDLGDVVKQRDLCERALKIKEAHYGPNRYEVAITLANLSVAYFKLQERSIALQMVQRTCAILINSPGYGIEHTTTKTIVRWIQSEGHFNLSDLHPSLMATWNNQATDPELKRADPLSAKKLASVPVDESKSSSASDPNISQERGDIKPEEATSTPDSESLTVHCQVPEAISIPTQTSTLAHPGSVLTTSGSPSLFASSLQPPNSSMNHVVPVHPLETKVDDSQASEETVADLSSVPP